MAPELFEFNQLASQQQAVARASVIAAELAAFKNSMKDAKYDFRHNLHAVINSAHHIPQLLRRQVALKRLRADTKHLEAVIVENQCRFSREGAMYLFMKNTFVTAETLLVETSLPSRLEANDAC